MTVGYRSAGHGPHKVLALHGWFGDETCFDPLRDALTLDEFTYVFMAYRGYGLSRQQRGEYTMKEIAADALALADALEWEEFSLIGHSMGGMAVQRVLADAPNRVSKIVAVTPVPASGVPFDPDSWKLFEGAARSLDNRRGIIDFSTGGRLSKAWIDRIARYSAETANMEAFAAYLQAWAKTDFHDEIKGNRVPLKVIIGAHDKALTEEAMRATYLAWYPNAELEVMANAGHYPMNETPVALATSIEAFLRRDAKRT
jgi:pimeloyl-ACP methyl ester carboxylesterase